MVWHSVDGEAFAGGGAVKWSTTMATDRRTVRRTPGPGPRGGHKDREPLGCAENSEFQDCLSAIKFRDNTRYSSDRLRLGPGKIFQALAFNYPPMNFRTNVPVFPHTFACIFWTPLPPLTWSHRSDPEFLEDVDSRGGSVVALNLRFISSRILKVWYRDNGWERDNHLNFGNVSPWMAMFLGQTWRIVQSWNLRELDG